MVSIVRPNLGNPLILKPGELERFEITIAYIKNWQDGNEEKEEDVSYPSLSQILALLRKDPPIISRDNVTMPLTVNRVYGYFRHPSYKDDYGKVIHAQTNQHQQYRNGFRWEARVEVGIDENSSKKLKDTFGWPHLFHLNLQGRKNYHAVYVHETLKSSNKFTILHITDTHISKRNDLIPGILCEVRNLTESQELKDRYINPNDNLRAFIREANQRLKNESVIVVLTGDIVDYYFDGYWDGHYVCGQQDFAPDRREAAAGSAWNSNVEKFHEIITGRDQKGEALKCPLFTIIGNHDYRSNEVLLNWICKLSLFDKELYKRDEYGSFGLLEREGNEYDFWAFPRKTGRHELIASRKTFKEYRLNEWKASLDQDFSYWLIKPRSWILGQYLCTVNYDLDFTIKMGNTSILCLNTAHDQFPKQEDLVYDELGLKDFPDWFHDFVKGGPHSRGITQEHLNLLAQAMNPQKEQLIFIFTHAPLINLPRYMGKYDAFDLYRESVRINELRPPMPILTQNWSRLCSHLQLVLSIPDYEENKAEPELGGKNAIIKAIESKGFPVINTGYFKHSPRDPYLNFSCADGQHAAFLKSITHETGKQTNQPVLFFSGHTHNAHEFRAGQKKGGATCFFTDEYSKSIFVPVNIDDGTNAVELLSLGARYEWLKQNSPLLMTSGAIKNREPQYREIVIRGQIPTSLAMKSIGFENVRKTGNYIPGCRIIALAAQNGQYLGNMGSHEITATCGKTDPMKNMELIHMESGKVAIRVTYINRYIRLKNNGLLDASLNKIDSSAEFTLIGVGVNKVALRANNGKYVCAEGGGGGTLVANRTAIGPWETFTLIEGETSGQIVLESSNFPDYFIRHRNYLGEIAKIQTTAERRDATFRIVPGLTSSAYPYERYFSLQPVNYPGHYLRHENFILKLSPFADNDLFRNDASFKMIPVWDKDVFYSFESVNFPGFFIRHKNFKLCLERGESDLFKKDSSFKISSPELAAR